MKSRGLRKQNIDLEIGVRPDKDIGDVLFLLFIEKMGNSLLMKMTLPVLLPEEVDFSKKKVILLIAIQVETHYL